MPTQETERKLKEDWYMTVSDKVMATVRTHLDKNEKLKKKFKVSNFNLVSNVAPDTLAVFPTIFYTELEPIEVGQDLANQTINAIRSTIEVRVYVNSGNDGDCAMLLRPIIEDFKSFGFNVNQFPIYTKTNNVVRGVIRCSRIVGADDQDLTYKIIPKKS